MKTQEELNVPKEEVETLNEKLHELTDEELAQVSGGLVPGFIGGHGLGVPGAAPHSVSEGPAL